MGIRHLKTIAEVKQYMLNIESQEYTVRKLSNPLGKFRLFKTYANLSNYDNLPDYFKAQSGSGCCIFSPPRFLSELQHIIHVAVLAEPKNCNSEYYCSINFQAYCTINCIKEGSMYYLNLTNLLIQSSIARPKTFRSTKRKKSSIINQYFYTCSPRLQ